MTTAFQKSAFQNDAFQVATAVLPVTSGSYAFSLTYDDVISEAYDRLGLRIDRQVGRQVRSALRSINLIFSEWSNRGVRAFSVATTTQGLALGQQSFALPSGCIDVLGATIRRNGRDLTMQRKSRREYHNIQYKAATGLPHVFWVDRQSATQTFYLWQTPALPTDSVSVQYVRQFQDASASNQDPDLPYRWSEAICSALCAQVALKEVPARFTEMYGKAEAAFDLAMAAEAEIGNVELEVMFGMAS